MNVRSIASAKITAVLCLLGAVLGGAPRAFAEPPTPTGVRGRVTDKRSGKPIESAPVLVQGGGSSETTLTDARGHFQVLLAPGTYVVRSYYELFHGARVSGVQLGQGQMIEVNLALTRIDEERDVAVEELEIPYRADTTSVAAQDQLRQASAGIGEGLGAKQMSQSGASDAGGAAARVVGVTIESSQLVIRGLGGRYTRVLLNGIPVPSVDPDIPGADLDLFPTSVIDSLTISKTFLPDNPADFAGGVMEIKSVSFPRQLTLQLDLSAGLDSQSTFRQRLDYRGGRFDRLGFDDGRRALPDAFPDDRPITSYPDEERHAAARTLRNSWQYRRKQAWPKLGFDFTLGDSITFAKRRRFGYLVTAGYELDSMRRIGRSRPNPIIAESGLVENASYAVETGTDEVRLSALGTASLDLGIDHSITVLSLFNRSVSDETSLQSGKSPDFPRLDKWQLQFVARTLWFNQLFGDHRNVLGTRLRLRWAAFHAYGERDEPDRRTVAYGDNGGTYEWLVRSGSGERFFSNLRQDDAGGTVSLRMPLWSEAWATVGGFSQISLREFGNRRFRMRKNQQNADGSVFQRPVEELLGPESIGRYTDITEETRPNDSYESRQLLYAGYLLVETPLYGPLSVSGGVRTEILSQKVDSRSPFTSRDRPTDQQGTDRTDTDFLPGAALKYTISPRLLLRAAYGMTVARPQIRELAPYQYYDFLRDRGVEGNPNLKRTLIHNADLRGEWFFAEGQVLAASAFYKRFIDPIELTILDPVTGGSRFENVTRAQNVGAEAELRLGLGRLAPALRRFSFDGNVALIRSRVDIPSDLARVVRASRPLAGQSPYVANLSLRFLDEHRGVTASLIYNVVGPRIADVATRVRVGDKEIVPPDIEEQAFHSLDFVAAAELGRHVKLKLKVRNLLFQDRELKQGDFLILRVDPALSGSVGLAVTY